MPSAEPGDAVLEQRERPGDVAGAAVDLLQAAVELHPLGGVGRRADLERLLEQPAGLAVVAALGRQHAEALAGLAHALAVAVHLGLPQHAAQELLGLLEPAHAAEHHRVEQLERARPLVGCRLARELLRADAEPAGDLHEHARAGAAVAGLDPGQIAVGAAVEREVALGHPALSAQVADAGAELAQRLVGVLALVELRDVHVLTFARLQPVHSWQSYCTRPFAARTERAGRVPHYTHRMPFPTTRLRRLRRTSGIRQMVRETRLTPSDLIQPLFVRHGGGESTPIESMPGQGHHGIDGLVETAVEVHAAGIPAVLIFGLPARKDEAGSEAYDPEGIVSSASARSRRRCPSSRSSPTCACASTPRTATAASCATGSSRTTSAWSSWPIPPSPMPRRAPTWSRPPT